MATAATDTTIIRPRWHAWAANGLAVVSGTVFFAWLLARNSSPLAALVSALVATALAVGLWAILWKLLGTLTSGTPVRGVNLGRIPDFTDLGPAPTLVSPQSTATAAFESAAERLEAHTNGQILLFASPTAGTGATSTAMNIAIAASRAGRRILLVDGDGSGAGVSRFGGSGSVPGLTDLARGVATLQEAARLWRVGQSSRLPVIPAGSPDHAGAALQTVTIADVFDRVSERADFVIVDSGPILSDPAITGLAAHADGTVLVVNERSSPTKVRQAQEQMERIGAPVVAHVVNRSRRKERTLVSRAMARFGVMLLVLLATFSLWTGWQLFQSWNSLDQVAIDTAAARDRVADQTADIDEDSGETVTADIADSLVPVASLEGDYFETYLVVGSDAREELGGSRADVIVILLLPRDGSAPGLVSLPRDLYLTNPCNPERARRINANLAGCGDVSGPDVLALAAEDFTGLKIDHFVLFDFDGFKAIIDRVGGHEICLEFPVRDRQAELDLPAGCSIADGDQTLAWVRSRNTQELVDGSWRTQPGVNDLTRNTRQQDVILDMFSKMSQLRSPTELTALVRELSDAFVLDQGIGINDAVDLAWSLRGMSSHEFARLEVPVEFYVTSAGASVLVPTEPFRDTLLAAYPDAPAASL